MNQIKIGNLLKELRIEKKLTQEDLADLFNVSNRTVSRWETGINMPDLSTLIELAKYYNISVEEILDGERKTNMIDNLETVLKIKEYSDKEKAIIKKKMLVISLFAIILLCFNILLESTQGFGFVKESTLLNMQSFISGLILGVLVLNVLYLSGWLDNVRQLKLKVLKKSKN